MGDLERYVNAAKVLSKESENKGKKSGVSIKDAVDFFDFAKKLDLRKRKIYVSRIEDIGFYNKKLLN